MPDEASVTIVTRMRDEASAKMQGLTKNMEAQTLSAQQLQTTLTATGSALAAVGSLMGQMESPTAKIASKFLVTAGAILSTASAIMSALPMLRSLITTLRSLAVAKAIAQAFSGPAGWATLAISAGVAAGAIAGISALTRTNQANAQAQIASVARPTTTAQVGGQAQGSRVTNVNINTPAFTGSQADARKFSRQMQTISREETRLGR